ncbi:MAG TPA: YicC/YloC family endoribonuclease [Candidatus Acidoferrales bacterium]|jgi:uncharacterized protein (TIGR00255 family)
MKAEPAKSPVKSSVNESAKPSNKIRSMTGYAEARADCDGWQLRVSLRSVNHRFLDLRVRLSEGFEFFEPAIRQLIRDRLRRGHVDVTLHVEAVGAAAIEVQHETAAAYLRAAEQLRREFGLSVEPDVVALLRLPGVVVSRGTDPALSEDEEYRDRLTRQAAACVEAALGRLEGMREAEGHSLAAEMHLLTASIGEKTAQLESLTTRSHPAYVARLKARLEELLGGPMDPGRLAQEAAILAERADVSEELARLRSHVGQFDTLVTNAGEIGKKLDFLLQEMQREANTLLSKTPALGEDALAVTDLGLQIKAEIEKLREQVQNVE